jgi:P-type Ca2+ transporter type 2C
MENLEGLTGTEVLAAQKTFGLNILREKKKLGKFRVFLLQFHNPMVYVLLVAVGVSTFMEEWINALAILAIVLLNALISFFQEIKSQSSLEALNKLTVPKARVKRDQKISLIDSLQIVPGDLLVVEAGDYVVADARLLKAAQLSADESILTGESIPVEKNIEDRIHSGTAISSGSGEALVTQTGMQTELGKIAGLLDRTLTTQTPLQLKMDSVSYKLLMLSGVIMLMILAIGLSKKLPLPEILMYAISLAVAAIPEGLPTVVTLALVLAVRRMTKRNAILRKLAAVETLGSANVICTDKTGTLTTGKMIVRETFTLEKGALDHGEPLSEDFYRVLALCNNASLDHGGSGDSTEVALLKLVEEHGKKVSLLNEKFKRLEEKSFDSDRKRMSVLVDQAAVKTLYCKGAPETILPLCQLTPKERARIEASIAELSSKGRRLLALSSKAVKEAKDSTESDLTFIGLVSLADPPKPESFGAIKACKEAGIKVVMITGDHPLTAKAIAQELGIIEKGVFEKVLSGQELDAMGEKDLEEQCEGVAVYARVTSEHKLKIVEALQKKGFVVGMTGDGVNDAPALKQASIGIAMGKSGTEVARQAADMILTDDNFSTIVSAIEEGRAVYGNIKRTLQYLLSTNTAELLIFFGTVALGMPNAFLPLSLLWINIVTDGLPSLALSVEPVGENSLAQSSGPSAKSFFDRKFLTELTVVALLMTLIELFVYHYTLEHYEVGFARSCAFNLMIYLCLSRSFSCRSDTQVYFKLKLNPLHLLSVLAPILLQIVLGYSRSYLELFQISRLPLEVHLLLLGVSLIPVSLVECTKLRFTKS